MRPTKDQIINFVDRQLEILQNGEYNCIILHILSHGNESGEFYASDGKKISFGDSELEVQDLASFDFSKTQIGLFSPGASISKEYAPKAAAAGCVNAPAFCLHLGSFHVSRWVLSNHSSLSM